MFSFITSLTSIIVYFRLQLAPCWDLHRVLRKKYVAKTENMVHFFFISESNPLIRVTVWETCYFSSTKTITQLYGLSGGIMYSVYKVHEVMKSQAQQKLHITYATMILAP